jgi:siroheme synthase-like protein
VSVYPIMLEGRCISALVVGGGTVAARKVRALVAAGARVHVVAPEICADLEQLAAIDAETVRLTRGSYAPEHITRATLVIAATDNPSINASVADDARDAGKLVNVADAPDSGDFVTPAVHRAGDVVIAVSAGGVPNAAARIRDSIAESVDERYASAVDALSRLRAMLLARGDRESWRSAASALIGPDFRDEVEAGRLTARIDAWR